MKKLNSIVLATVLCAGVVVPALAQAAPWGWPSSDNGGKASGGGAPLAGVTESESPQDYWTPAPGFHAPVAMQSNSHCQWVLNHPSHYRASTVRACRQTM